MADSRQLGARKREMERQREKEREREGLLKRKEIEGLV